MGRRLERRIRRIRFRRRIRRIWRRRFRRRWSLEWFESGAVMTPARRLWRRVIRGLNDGLKILGDGRLDKAQTVRAHKFRRRAVDKSGACGGAADETR